PLITLHDRELDRLRDTDRKRVRRLQRQYVEVWVEAVRALYPSLPEGEARVT
ncbi:MAG TPA: TetR family transcriptional regulator, partial [Streptomyces sp.]|nr:TetR family transcriptional regulator [Streptomyces sp.]